MYKFLRSDRQLLESLDIIFISYNESNADKNWLELKARFPQAMRVHGVVGIENAHYEAAQKSQSDFFFIVDGDNRVRNDFNFSIAGLNLEKDTLYVWRCLNPINQLVYGYGAIKLYNKELLSTKKQKFVDLATTVSAKYKIIDELASETHFFNTPEEAWRGAFRECAKLSSQALYGQKSEETLIRLTQWSDIKKKHINAKWIVLGAKEVKQFAKENADKLYLLNDFTWLKETFEKHEL